MAISFPFKVVSSFAESTRNWEVLSKLSYLTTQLASGKIFVGNASGVATETTMSGDVTIDNTGATTIGAGKVTNAKVASNAAIDFSKLATLSSTQLIVGNASNIAQARTITGDVTIDNAGVTAITAGSIVNADVNAAAAIAASKLDARLAQSTVENLKVIRGIINTAGTGSIVKGSGFSITRNATGDITVTFTSAFSDVPTCTGNYGTAGFNATVQLNYNTTPTASLCRFQCISIDGTQVGRDGLLHFTAWGPR